MSDKQPPKVYSKEEVAKHTEPEDLWMVISGRVYNLTPFLEEHPGGDGVLMDNAGQDATSAFDDVGHSEEAHEMMKQYYIGDLEGANPTPLTPREAEKKKEAKKTAEAPNPAMWKQVAIPVLIIAMGLAIRYYWLE